MTFEGAPATVCVDELVPDIDGDAPVIDALTPDASSAMLLGCHEVVTVPVALVCAELGVKVVVPLVGYPPAAALKEIGTPG